MADQNTNFAVEAASWFEKVIGETGAVPPFADLTAAYPGADYRFDDDGLTVVFADRTLLRVDSGQFWSVYSICPDCGQHFDCGHDPADCLTNQELRADAEADECEQRAYEQSRYDAANPPPLTDPHMETWQSETGLA